MQDARPYPDRPDRRAGRLPSRRGCQFPLESESRIRMRSVPYCTFQTADIHRGNPDVHRRALNPETQKDTSS